MNDWKSTPEKTPVLRLLQMNIERCDTCPLSIPVRISDENTEYGRTQCNHPQHFRHILDNMSPTGYVPVSECSVPEGTIDSSCPLPFTPRMIPKPSIISFLMDFYITITTKFINGKETNIRGFLKEFTGFSMSEETMDFAVDAIRGDVRKNWDPTAGILKLEDLYQSLIKEIQETEAGQNNGLFSSYDEARIDVVKEMAIKLGNILEHK